MYIQVKTLCVIPVVLSHYTYMGYNNIPQYTYPHTAVQSRAVHHPTHVPHGVVPHGVVPHVQHSRVQAPSQGPNADVAIGARENYKVPSSLGHYVSTTRVPNKYMVHNVAGHHIGSYQGHVQQGGEVHPSQLGGRCVGHHGYVVPCQVKGK